MLGHSWYNLGEVTAYPLVDQATGIPQDFIADCSIVLPAELGTRVRVAAASCSAALSSLALVSDTGAPVGTASATADERGAPVQLSPAAAGVAGFVVFGSLAPPAREVYTPTGAWLIPLTVSVLSAPTVTSLGVNGIGVLQGLVALTAGTGVEVILADQVATSTPDYDENPRLQRVIHGTPVSAIVLRLNTDELGLAAAEALSGTCAVDARFGRCPQRILRTINGVAGASGVFGIAVTGDEITSSVSGNTLSISCPVGLEDVCTASKTTGKFEEAKQAECEDETP